MYISTFHLMPHRELPDDFEKRYSSVWVTPPFHELATPERVGQFYNWTLDELIAAAKAGSDGICTNEHHQNAYGFMPNWGRCWRAPRRTSIAPSCSSARACPARSLPSASPKSTP